MRCLYKLALTGREPASVADLDLTQGEYTNFAKLAYWGLARKANPNNSERGGMWKITDTGMRFITGQISLPKKLWVYRNEVVLRESKQVGIEDITGGWKYKPHYVREREDHDPDPYQPDLL